LNTNAPLISFTSPLVHVVGSLWRRILAFVVDGLILYAVGRVIGTIFLRGLSLLGPWALLVGFCLALAYFGTLESEIGRGQSLGKRLLRLRVANSQGSLIKWKTSAARYTIFAIPIFLIGLRLPAQSTPWIVPFLLPFIAFGIGGSTLYLMLFNRRTRQGLHDIAVETFVADTHASGSLTTKRVWGMHWWVIGAFLSLLTLTALSKGISINWHLKSGHVYQNEEDVRLIEKLGGVQTAEVLVSGTIHQDGYAIRAILPKKKCVTVIVQWNGEIGARQSFAGQVAKIILQYDPRAEEQDLVRIEVGRSFNLGIASGNDNESFIYTPTEWHQRVFGGLPYATPSAEPTR